MKAAIVYDSGTHTTKKMKSWADVFVAYFQRGIKRNIVPRLGIEIEHFIVSHDTKTAVPYDGKNGVREIAYGALSECDGADGGRFIIRFFNRRFHCHP
ncbi:hypothetical protein [Selenomonas ruminantium]|uniref:hypothetical protein n=1 Tax=Selenomonas ruminantium TaxID=971 RepID=UPI00156A5C14|nr:hypothetical protein [Selenomonas ruminantium]